jgi:hypothetical protein
VIAFLEAFLDAGDDLAALSVLGPGFAMSSAAGISLLDCSPAWGTSLFSITFNSAASSSPSVNGLSKHSSTSAQGVHYAFILQYFYIFCMLDRRAGVRSTQNLQK